VANGFGEDLVQFIVTPAISGVDSMNAEEHVQNVMRYQRFARMKPALLKRAVLKPAPLEPALLKLTLRKLALAISVLSAAAIVATPSAAAAAEYQGRFERTLTVSGPVELSVDSGSGSITVDSGGSGSVRIVGTIRANPWRLRGGSDLEARVKRIESQPPIEQNGSRIAVGKERDQSLYENISVSYEIVVPETTSLTTHTGSGSVHVGALRGPVNVSSGSGSLHIGATGGAVEASTGSGEINVAGAKGRVQAHSGSGSIYLRNISGDSSADAGSGSIVVEQTGPGEVRVSNSSGSIKVSGVQGGLMARTSSGSIDAQGAPANRWELSSSSGSIRMALPANAAFTLNAHTGSGSINIDHPVTVQGSIDKHHLQGTVRGGGPTIAADTSSGSIDISAGSGTP
jgi:DUF4097 and DUF4098 domain-containing protein YvlB